MLLTVSAVSIESCLIKSLYRFYKAAAEPDIRAKFQGWEAHKDLLVEEHVMWGRSEPQNVQSLVTVIAYC